ncbi:hypothetical protein B0A49_02635 [Cryomyces minteri]|uniref:5-formyltetrahydrofolate cyclo-ligase n=1 Tax=Cryomyces minteri TaxID=331657 RepID=A0A4V6WL17_9PEZI|nr:hypothetical protein B0A49_02635 [Cryomyces minteri]
MDMLELHSMDDYESLKPDKWGIPSLGKDTATGRYNCFGKQGPSVRLLQQLPPGSRALDMIVMPGMAFDERLGRLGHGKGFYDRFLQRYKEIDKSVADASGEEPKMPLLVGLALTEQVLAPDQTVPMTATDWPLDALVTGDGKLRLPDCAS